MTDQLPADIAEAIEAFALACEDMGASYDSRGFPSDERERVAAEANAALYAAILKHLGSGNEPDDLAGKVSAEAYQIIGALAGAAGLFEDDATIKVLDYFADEEWRKPNAEILPWSVPTDLGRSALAEEGGGR